MSQLSRGQSEKDKIASRLWALQTRLGKTQPSAISHQQSGINLRSSVLGPRSAELVVSGVDTGSKTGTLPSGPLGLSDRPGQTVSLPSGQAEEADPARGAVGAGRLARAEALYPGRRVVSGHSAGAGGCRAGPQGQPPQSAALCRWPGAGDQGECEKGRPVWLSGFHRVLRDRAGYAFHRDPSVLAGGGGEARPAGSRRWAPFTGQAGADPVFPSRWRQKPRTIYFAALKNGDASNFFGPMVWTTPVEQVLSVSHLDPAPPGEATLEVALQGATEGTHQVQVQLNGAQVGSLVFADQSQGVVTLSVSQSLLLEGDNRVSLVAQGGEMDVSLVDYIRLTYWHTYTADSDTLRFTASGGQQLLIDGFSSSRVRVVDITDPKVVQEVVGQVKPQGSGYAVQFVVPGNGPRTLLAFTGDQVKSAAAVEANQTSRWYQAGWGADLVMISHGSFLESVRPLKALREAQGWSVALVDVEDLYDEFSFGVKTPQALKDFLLRARVYWQKSPAFCAFGGGCQLGPAQLFGVGEF